MTRHSIRNALLAVFLLRRVGHVEAVTSVTKKRVSWKVPKDTIVDEKAGTREIWTYFVQFEGARRESKYAEHQDTRRSGVCSCKTGQHGQVSSKGHILGVLGPLAATLMEARASERYQRVRP